jgi:hypothetical protein
VEVGEGKMKAWLTLRRFRRRRSGKAAAYGGMVAVWCV